MSCARLQIKAEAMSVIGGWKEASAEIERLASPIFEASIAAQMEAYRRRFGLASADEAWRHLMGDPYIWIDPFEGRG